jgi:8-oxo-dGTP diphosphatase
MATDQRHSVSVAGVVIDEEGRALIIQRRDNGNWEPPGGVLEHGETIEDGLRREIYEETGIKIEPGPLTGVYQNMRRNIIALVFRCRPVAGQLTENDEAAAFRWAGPDEIRDLMTEAYATRIVDGLSSSSGAAVRAHDGAILL